jgi:hypothetical protein
MYGYGSGKKSKRVWTSTSGWESSHFGGYNRIVYDYPFIQMDWKAVIDIPESLRKSQGIYVSEKLIKMYIMKVKEKGYVQHLRTEIVKKKNIIGRETTFQSISLDNAAVLSNICREFKEFAPLFDHYQDEILQTSIMIEVEEPQQQQGGGSGEDGEDGEDGEQEQKGGSGEGEGEGEKKSDKSSGDSEGDGEQDHEEKESKESGAKDSKGSGGSASGGGGWGGSDFEAIQKLIEDMKESKPISRWGNLGLGEFGKPSFVTYSDNELSGYREYDFTQQEKQNAELLLKKLDISFDPKSDEVKNLRLGKLDTSKIAEVPAGNISVYKQTLDEQDTKEFAVCVLADLSGSMDDGVRLQTQFTVLNSLYLALSEIIPESDLHIYGHSGGGAEPKIYTFCNPYSPNYKKNIQKYYSISNASNYDGLVIQEVHKKIREKTDRPVVLVSISDGQPCDDINAMKQILERARRDQFVTVGIGIDTDYVKELYQFSRTVSQSKMSEMPNEVAGIINHVVKTEFQ